MLINCVGCPSYVTLWLDHGGGMTHKGLPLYRAGVLCTETGRLKVGLFSYVALGLCPN